MITQQLHEHLVKSVPKYENAKYCSRMSTGFKESKSVDEDWNEKHSFWRNVVIECSKFEGKSVRKISELRSLFKPHNATEAVGWATVLVRVFFIIPKLFSNQMF